MLEVLSPAGSSDALVAAVQNGADAVYLGYGSFNARMNAKNFTSEQLRQSVSYCHIRGVKVYLTLNTLVLDRELKAAAQVVLDAKNAGVDAILVQDLGVLQMVRQVAPDMPIHASTQMSVHNLEGVLKAAEMGVSRVVLARELSRSQIAAICQASPIELEVFVHGALCMCHSGQCYMSAMIGRRSGNRGQCAQPCRMSYGFDRSENRYPLRLKDNCLVSYLRDLERMGVACVKIEGRMKRAEYVAITTRIYKDAAQGKPVTDQQIKTLRKVFSRQGFTDGYYKGKIGADMFGTRQDEEQDRKLFAAARATYEHSETQRVTVAMEMSVRYGYPTTLTAIDKDGNWAQVQGDMPELAVSRPLDQAALEGAGLISYGSNVKEVTSQVAEAAVDFGVVYQTDAFSAGLTVADTATKEMCGQVIYPAAVTKTSQNAEAARDFLAFLSTPEAGEVFARVGFTPLG